MAKVMVGMSGGVDSAVSAYVLKKEGYDVVGVNCRFYDEDKAAVPQDVLDAKNVADKVGIPFTTYELYDGFESKVISPFIASYLKGETPNPCIECNRHLKFGKMLEKAIDEGFDYIATGHYARIDFDEASGRYLLKKGADESKDQSYVLYPLTQHQLRHTLFPLGNMTKDMARSLAEEMSFVNARKHDSQDICFIPDGDYASFIEGRLDYTLPKGNFIDTEGNILGEHQGIIHYTVGQRKGLGIALGKPAFVQSKNAEDNTVVLGSNEGLFKRELTARDINLIAYDKLTQPLRCKARIRYNAKEQWATVTQTDENHLHIIFDEPQRAISKGQAVVLYDGDIVIGGGTIE